MKRFTERVERDLGQIADRATPSSTAWEAIQQRIDEQDTATEPTMEVIMLSPGRNESPTRSRTWMLIAASVAAVALVGGLIVAANRDSDTVPADRPAVSVPETQVDGEAAVDPDAQQPDAQQPVEPEPVPAEPDSADAGEQLPEIEPLQQGTFVPTCTIGDAADDSANGRFAVQQTCVIAGDAEQPFRADQTMELSLLENAGTDQTPAGAFVTLSENGFMNAGLLWDDGTRGRWIGLAEGEGDYEGAAVYLYGSSLQFPDGSEEFDGHWWVGEGAQPSTSDQTETVVDVSFVCEQVASVDPETTHTQTCTYDSADPRFIPGPETIDVNVFPADFATTADGSGAVMSTDFFTSVSDADAIRSGLVTAGQVIRWSGMRSGSGELEGMLIHELGWGEVAEGDVDGTSTLTGIIQMTVVPSD